MGITLKDPVALLLVQEMEYRLREIIHVPLTLKTTITL